MILSPTLSLVALCALGAYLLAMLAARAPAAWATAALALGWLLHLVLLLLNVSGVGADAEGARFGFGSVLSTTVWLVLAVHAVESRFVPLPSVRRVLAGAGVLAVALVWAFPGEQRMSAMAPLLPLHWLLGVASYGLFGAAVLHARWLDMAEARLRGPVSPAPQVQTMPLLRLERLTFRFIEAGFAVLSAALVLGVATAHPWHWNHKAVFSTLAWLVFAALLAGRRWRGWRGRKATRWLYTGALLLLLGYAGSRFVFEVILGRSAAGS